ncbi:MAG: YitT family protein, partial [Clostridia bacterium]|nr:YitT family protein [Clostridia bacterium]
MKNIKSFFTKSNLKLFAVDTLYDIIGSILYGIGIYTFASKADFAPGGIAGVAIIINHYLPWVPIGICQLIINIPVAIICYKTLGKRFFIKSVKSMLISSFFIDVILPLVPTYQGERLLAAIFAGVLSGAGLALIYMRGSSTGGTDFIIMSIRK